MNNPVLSVRGLVKHYRLPRTKLLDAPGVVHGLNGVDFEVDAAKSFGIVGESGCGKSTLARTIMALEPVTAGSVELMGVDLARISRRDLRKMRRHFQLIFQDPYGSLDPRFKIGRTVGEPLDSLEPGLSRSERNARIVESLQLVGLTESDTQKFPHEFSGGQRQRIAIARAIVMRPALIIADEPVSALDVSVQAQVLNHMRELQKMSGISYVLISHDLAVVEYVCHETAVMYLGRFVERGPTERLLSNPAHPYTKALLEAVPQPLERKRRHRFKLEGAVSQLMAVQPGCAFADRCPVVQELCHRSAPEYREIETGHMVACHFATEH